MITKNQEFDVEITGYSSDGQGVARKDGFVIFVPFVATGELVKVHIIKVTKSYAVGKVVEIVKSSEHRVLSKCEHFQKCGGCSIQHMCYKAQLDLKKQSVNDTLAKIGGFDNKGLVQEIVASENQYFYRNKSAFPLFISQEQKLEICMFKGLSHDPIFIKQCPITYEQNMRVAFAFRDAVNKFFNEAKHFMKYLVIRSLENKILVTIVTTKHIKNAKVLYDAIKNDLNLDEKQFGLFECIKQKDNNVILEGKLNHLCGTYNIEIEIMNTKISISPMSFFQVNFEVMQKIYEYVSTLIQSEIVVDCYSGAGLMSAILTKSAKQVYGIEIVEDATKDANILKEKNGIRNLENINGDARVILPQLQKKLDKFSLVIDPPRKGVSEEVINSILQSKPQNIVYVSCNPATLARDLKALCQSVYQIESVKAFDMFPQTSHVETVAHLVLKK